MRIALFVASLGLCGLVIVQWTRESRLRTELSEMDVRLKSSEANASDLADKVRTWEEEIRRLTEVNAAATAKAEEQVKEIARLTAILTEHDAAAAKTPAIPADFVEIMQARNEEVTKQNEAIAKQNTALQKLVLERDALTSKLNARTREFNELTIKYNKIAK